jgi:hypothetical protein
MAGSVVQFLEADLRTPLPRKFVFTDPEKIIGKTRRSAGKFRKQADAGAWD